MTLNRHTKHTTERRACSQQQLHQSFSFFSTVKVSGAAPPHRFNFTTKWSAVSSHSHCRVFLVIDNTPHVGRGAGGLQGSVPPLSGVHEGGGRVGVPDVLRVQKLSLVGHDLRGLLAVEHGEVGGHVDEDAGVGGEAAGGLGPHHLRGVLSGGGGGGGGAGGRGCAGLTGRGTPGGPGAGHHRDGFQEAPPTAGPPP